MIGAKTRHPTYPGEWKVTGNLNMGEGWFIMCQVDGIWRSDIISNETLQRFIVSLPQENFNFGKKCTCGCTSVGCDNHSYWCDLVRKTA